MTAHDDRARDEQPPSWDIHEGDAAAVLPTLPAESVDTVVTSPAYFWQRDYGVPGQYGMEPTVQGFVDNLVTALREVRRVLKPHGTVFLNLGDTYYSAKGRPHGVDRKHRSRRMDVLRAVDGPGLGLPRKSLIGIPWRTALGLQCDGWTLRKDIIWERKTAIPEPTSKDRPWRSFEYVFMFSKQPRYHFDRLALGAEEDVWRIEPDRNATARGLHFAPYPRELVRRCIAIGCPPGGVVLDPFAGGGTTLDVALDMGRSAIGVDLNPTFVELVRTRLSSRTEPIDGQAS